MSKLVKWFKDLLYEEYEVEIWYDADPTKITKYKLNKIDKLTSTVLKGRDADGFSVELQVQTPFNYQVKKIH
jgi:hypothetical protein